MRCSCVCCPKAFAVPGIQMETIRIPAATAKQTNIPTRAQDEELSRNLPLSRSMDDLCWREEVSVMLCR